MLSLARLPTNVLISSNKVRRVNISKQIAWVNSNCRSFCEEDINTKDKFNIVYFPGTVGVTGV